MFVVSGGGFRRTELRFFWSVRTEEGVLERRDRRLRLWARVRERRSVARNEAVTSADGGSPKMKNFMKAPRRSTMESWPRSRPCVKESLGCQPCVRRVWGSVRGFGFGEGWHVGCGHIGARIGLLSKIWRESEWWLSNETGSFVKCGQDIEAMLKKFGARLRRHWCGGDKAENPGSHSRL